MQWVYGLGVKESYLKLKGWRTKKVSRGRDEGVEKF